MQNDKTPLQQQRDDKLERLEEHTKRQHRLSYVLYCAIGLSIVFAAIDLNWHSMLGWITAMVLNHTNYKMHTWNLRSAKMQKEVDDIMYKEL